MVFIHSYFYERAPGVIHTEGSACITPEMWPADEVTRVMENELRVEGGSWFLKVLDFEQPVSACQLCNPVAPEEAHAAVAGVADMDAEISSEPAATPPAQT